MSEAGEQGARSVPWGGAWAAHGAPVAALKPVSVQQPTLIASFSYDNVRTLRFDDSAKRWYRDPPTMENGGNGSGVPADLNYGLQDFQDKAHVPDPLDSVLYTLMHRADHPGDMDGVRGAPQVPAENVEMELLRANVITWRGIMTKLCTAWSCHVQAPLMFREGFSLNVMMVHGNARRADEQLGDTLIIEETPPTVQEHAMQESKPKSRDQVRNTYYGYNFESFCTTDSPSAHTDARATGHPIGWGSAVDTNVQWCHIMKSRLGNARILMGGEVDCVETDSGRPTERVVELKTNRELRTAEDEKRLNIKMLKIYMQSFLLGVPVVVMGFRNNKGILSASKTYHTRDLPRMVRGKPYQWDANHNLAFGSHLLAFLREAIGKEMEKWSFHITNAIRRNERYRGPYAWRVHRTTTGSFLGHLPLPAPEDAEQEYPVFRATFQPPFTGVSIRHVPPHELQFDGRRRERCGIVPTAFYRWVTEPMADVVAEKGEGAAG
ncbi:decapping endonuclease targeting mRNA [Malassezia sp. CBS 17886]|nr:decapping endonuclease targeting mRNA [Malassezia sp. CBS 17886]